MKLIDRLLALPEPILVVSHKNPDLDGISGISALIHFLRWHGKEIYTRTEGTILPEASWILTEDDFCKGPVGQSVNILKEAESLVVIDCQADQDRLGFDPSAFKNIVVADHHAADFDKNDPEKGVYVEDVPSAGCTLINGGIVHPILYAGLWADTVGFKFNTLRAMSYVNLLVGRCGQEPEVFGCDTKLTQELIDYYHSQIYRKFHLDFLLAFKRLEINKIHFGDHILLTCRSEASLPGIDKELLSVLCQSANTVVIVNKLSGKVSLRTDGRDDISVLDIASKYGGGGHRAASGCSLKDGYVDLRLFHKFSDKVTSLISKQLKQDEPTRIDLIR